MAPQNIGCQAQEIQAPKSNEIKVKAEVEGSLTIEAQGFNSTPIDITLFKVSQKTIPYRQQSISPVDGKARVTFTQIPIGDYAIRVSSGSKKVKVRLTANSYSQNEERIFGPIWKKSQFHMNKADMIVVLTARK